MTLNANIAAGNNYPAMFTSSASGNSAAPSVSAQNATYINKASTVTDIEIDTQNNATDGTELFTLTVNGVASAGAVTVVNGTKRGMATGLSIALVPGDYISYNYSSGASGNIGRSLVTTFLTTP